MAIWIPAKLCFLKADLEIKFQIQVSSASSVTGRQPLHPPTFARHVFLEAKEMTDAKNC